MQLNKVSFVGADFEIGQTRKGLTESSNLFIENLQKYQVYHNLNFEVLKQIKLPMPENPVHCFSELDLFRMNIKKYEELCLTTLRGLNTTGSCLNFGGDHSIAIATVEASLRKNPSTHVIWIDAHADANSIEESISGNFHGMPIYYLLKKQWERPMLLQWMQKVLKPEQLTYIGLRDLDAFELRLLKDKNIRYFTAEQVRNGGIEHILTYLKNKNKLYEKIHLSFDIDSLDPSYGLCTGVPVPSGLKLNEVEKIFHLICESGKLSNADFSRPIEVK